MQDTIPQKTEISQREANWKVHVAGMNAADAARASGVTPDTAAELLDAVTPFTVAGVTFKPLHAGFLMMLPRLDALREHLVSFTTEGGQLAAISFLLAEPKDAWALLRHNDNGQRFESAAFEFATQFSLSELRDLAAWVAKQMAALQEDPQPGKPETPSPLPPTTPT